MSLARNLRATPTAAEGRMWRILHPFRTNGFHFRKQHAIGSYVVDFVCIYAGLAIEVDGHTHGTASAQANDAVRDDYLGGRGFTVLRFTNRDVLHKAEGVFTMVETALAARSPRRGAPPSPTLPAGGRVPPGGRNTMVPQPQLGTHRLAGDDGRSVPRSNQGEQP